jgi:hypothetical protein
MAAFSLVNFFKCRGSIPEELCRGHRPAQRGEGRIVVRLHAAVSCIPREFECLCGQTWTGDESENRCPVCGIALTTVEEIEAADFHTEAGRIDGVIVPRDALQRAARELCDAAEMLDHAARERADDDYGEAAKQARQAAAEVELLLGALP